MNPPELPSELPPPLPNSNGGGQPQVLPKSPTVLSWALIGRMNVSLLLAGLNAWALSFSDPEEGLLLTLFLLLLVGSSLCMVLLLRHFWQKIDDGTAPYSPNKYALLNLVPVFNLYWQFVCYLGLTRAINKELAARGKADLEVSTGLAMARGVFGVIGFIVPLCLAEDISFLAILAGACLISPVLVILDFILFRKYIRAFTALEGSQS